MASIDWRKLYAANQAAIAAAGGKPPPALKPKVPKGFRPPGKAARRPARARSAPPPGRGRWEMRSHEGPAGRRAYALYTPQGLASGPAPLLLMLHGCTQSPVDIARGTHWNQLADRHGLVVAYPEQTHEHNEQACWNWFVARHQRRGSGEPAVLAGLAHEVAGHASRVPIDRERVFLAGMSAGGAMAAVVAATHPEVFRAVGVHSGLPYRAATSQRGAFEAMARGGGDAGPDGAEVHEAMGEAARVVPILVVHGTEDRVVAPVNGDELVGQWLAANRLAGAELADGAVVHGGIDGGHPYTRRRWSYADGRLVQEYLRVEGLGHAWSGGARGGSYVDPRGPDATQAMWDFFVAAAGA